MLKIDIPAARKEPVELFGKTFYVRQMGYREMVALLAKASKAGEDADGLLIAASVVDDKGNSMTLEQVYALPQKEHDLLAAKAVEMNKLGEAGNGSAGAKSS